MLTATAQIGYAWLTDFICLMNKGTSISDSDNIKTEFSAKLFLNVNINAKNRNINTEFTLYGNVFSVSLLGMFNYPFWLKLIAQ